MGRAGRGPKVMCFLYMGKTGREYEEVFLIMGRKGKSSKDVFVSRNCIKGKETVLVVLIGNVIPVYTKFMVEGFQTPLSLLVTFCNT